MPPAGPAPATGAVGPVLPTLHGRDVALDRLDELAARAAAGRAGAVVVSGHAGMGRTALLDASAARLAATALVLRCTGSPAARVVAFGGLQRLLEPVAARIAPLSGQRPHLLAAALGVEPAAPVEDLTRVPVVHLGHALVHFLSLLAEHRPIVVQVDDAAALDPSSLTVLRFAADRLRDDRVAVVFSASPRRAAQLAADSVPLLELGPLPRAAAAAVLHDHHTGLAPGAAEWTLHTARGMPLALTLLPALSSPDPVEDGSGREIHGAASGEHEGRGAPPWQLVARLAAERLAGSTPEARLAALVVTGDDLTPSQARRALAALELPTAALDEVLETPMFRRTEAGPRVVHPSLGPVVATITDATALRSAHRALAGVVTDPARRARHLAAATIGKDEAAAGALEAAAAAAERRGGSAEAAEAFDLAAQRTQAGEALRGRLEAGATAYLRARDGAGFVRLGNRLLEQTRSDAVRGRLFATRVLAEEAHELPADREADLERRALIASAAAPQAAAEILTALAVRRLAAGSYREAHRTVVRAHDHERHAAAAQRSAGGSAVGGGQAGREGGSGGGRDHTPVAVASGGLSTLQLRIELVRSSAAVALGDDAAGARLDHPWERLTADEELARRPLPACHGAEALLWLGRPERAAAMLDRLDAVLRPGGSPARARVLTTRARLRIRTGDWIGARIDLAAAVDVATLARATAPIAEATAVAGWLAAVCGAGDLAADLLQRAEGLDPAAPRTRHAVALGRAMLALSSGDGHEALAPLAEARSVEDQCGLAEPGASTRVGDLGEAAWRSRSKEVATEDLAAFEQRAEDLGRAPALAIAARSRALLAEHDFEDRFEQALTLHGTVLDPFERARTELCLAERLSQARRRREARPPLRSALSSFEALGAEPWAQRARAELEACGEHRPPPAGATHVGSLPIRQLRAARALAEGARVADIARELLVSRRTVARDLERARVALGVADDAALIARLRP